MFLSEHFRAAAMFNRPLIPDRVLLRPTPAAFVSMFPIGKHPMDERDGTIGQRASEVARAFGSLVRRRRRALTMTQDQLALITGVGRRFLIDLEAGKTSCQLGRSLVVAQALGLRPTEGLNGGELSPSATVPDLPDLPDDEEELHG